MYIFNLATGTLIKTIDTGATGDNGLTTPGVFDSDGDGDIDFIYAGDLKGNVWKFDVTDGDPTNWDVALSGTPLFQAMDTSTPSLPQPITAQITVAVNNVEGDPNKDKRFIFFGTGSYFNTGDPNDLQVQTWYGLIDENTPISSRSDLTQRTLLAEGTFSGKLARTISEAVITPTNDIEGKKGWYLDLSINNIAEGERMVTSSRVYELAEPVLIASSIIPVVDPCIPGGKGYINAVNPFTGARLKLGFFDLNNNGTFTDDKLNDVNISSFDIEVGMPSEPVLIGNRLVVGGSSGEIKDVAVNIGSSGGGKRVSWREIIQK